MKKLLITTLSSVLFTGLVFAQDDIITPYSPSLSSVFHVKEERDSDKVLRATSFEKLNKKAAKLIEERLKALEGNKEAVEKNKALSVENKTALTTQLSSGITAMNSLSARLASSTDATSTRAIITSMFNDYRIFGIVIPKVRLEARVYQLKAHAAKLSETFIKIQAKIDEQKAKGKDVTSWQKGLDDAKVLVAQNMFKLDGLLVKTSTLTPAVYGTTSKATIEAVNQDLKLISKDFNTIVSKVKKPQTLKKSVGGSATTTIR